MTIEEKIAPLAIALLLEAPLYGHLLSGLVKWPEKGGDLVLGIEEYQLVLRINDDWLGTATPGGELRGRIKHELLHLIFRHPLQREAYPNAALFHLAADLVVNQYLTEEELGPEELTREQLDPLPLKEGGTLEDYYHVLTDAWAAIRKGAGTKTAGWVRMMERCFSGRHPAFRRHRHWAAGPFFQSTAAGSVLDAQITELLRRVRQQIGPEGIEALPLSIRLAVAGSEGAAQVDWRRTIRLFSASSRKTRLKNTIRRPSKRYGTSPGLQVVRPARLLVAVDTSGSVGEASLSAFFREIHHLWRQGNELLIVECDSVIQRRYEYQGHLPEEVRGRGSTSYDPPLRWANQHYRPDGILYFTDGQGPTPTVRSYAPLLWVIAGSAGRHLPGRRVRLEIWR